MDEKLHHLTPEQRETLVLRLTEILHQEPIVLGAWLHGSFHEGLPFHDIDVAVYLDPASEATHDPLTLMLELGDRLERAVRLPVDVRVLNGAPLSFQFRATGGRPLLLRDEDACYAFVEHVRRMYWGFRTDDTPLTAGYVGMKRVDVNVVRTKTAAIRRNIDRVRSLVSLPDDQFWSDERNIETIKLWLIQLVQDAADLCNHLSVRLLNTPPESYPECFDRLQEAQILDATLAQHGAISQLDRASVLGCG